MSPMAAVAADAVRPEAPGPAEHPHRHPTISVRKRLRDVAFAASCSINLVRTEIKVKYKNSVLGIGVVDGRAGHDAGHLLRGLPIVLENHSPNFVIFLLRPAAVELVPVGGACRHRCGRQQRGHRRRRFPSPGRSWPWPRSDRPASSSSSSPSYGHLHGRSCASARTGELPVLLLCPGRRIVLAAAIAVLLSCINVYLRDTQHLIEVILTAWFWACPIVYAFQSNISEKLGPKGLLWVYLLNPMVPLVLSFQRCIYAAPDHLRRRQRT